MTYSLNVNQFAADRLGLTGKVDLIDLCLLDSFADFANSSRCEKKVDASGSIWFWISYKTIIDAVPLALLKNSDSVYRRMKKLEAVGLIVFHPDNQKTNRTFFKWGENHDAYVFSKPTDQNAEVAKPTDEKSEVDRLTSGSKRGHLRIKTRTPPDQNADYYNTNYNNKTKEGEEGSRNCAPPPSLENQIFPLGAKKEKKEEVAPAAPREFSPAPPVAVTLYEQINGTPTKVAIHEPEAVTTTAKPAKAKPAISPIVVEVVEYLNRATGKSFRAETKGYDLPILARMKEGHTLEEMKMVIDNRVRAWGCDDKMRDYLTPTTIFRPTNFANYLASARQAPAPQQQPRPQPQASQPSVLPNNIRRFTAGTA